VASGFSDQHHQTRAEVKQELYEYIECFTTVPLPCSIRSVMRWLSMSLTFSDTTSLARKPAP
jgi:hypothetical protein